MRSACVRYLSVFFLLAIAARRSFKGVLGHDSRKCRSLFRDTICLTCLLQSYPILSESHCLLVYLTVLFVFNFVCFFFGVSVGLSAAILVCLCSRLKFRPSTNRTVCADFKVFSEANHLLHWPHRARNFEQTAGILCRTISCCTPAIFIEHTCCLHEHTVRLCTQ